MRDVCADFDTELAEFNGERDHVHLLVHYPPKVALSRLVGSLKGVSARRLRQEFPAHIREYLWGDHFWSLARSTLTERASSSPAHRACRLRPLEPQRVRSRLPRSLRLTT